MSTVNSFEALLGDRFSCRAFLPEPLDDQVLDRLFSMAQRTPSWCNTQPWEVDLLGGEELASFGKSLREHVASQEPFADLGLPSYAGVHDERRREAGYSLYSALGIERSDRAARSAQMMENFSFFGAPHTAIVTTAKSLGVYGAVDCGGYVNVLMLAAQSLGLGTIAQGAVAMYSDHVREWLGLAEDRQVVCAVSLGRPDESALVNAFRTSRADVAGVVRRIG